MIELKLTENEAQALYEIMDIATKSGGIQVAKASLPITDKLMQAVKDSQEKEKDDSSI